jgi:endonuclease/exonuclease/phosphatase family metal-dependent hydrolase
MSFHFNAAMLIEAEEYGDALLTRRPERLMRKGALPTIRGIPGLEPRGAVWAAIDFDGVELNVINTHLGLVPREQRLQAAALMGKDWLGHPDCVGPTILTGDFNATSITRPYQTLCAGLTDCQRQLGLKPTVKTFPSAFPAIRIDHAFVSPHIRITGVKAPFSPLARVASDHLPLVIDFEIATAGLVLVGTVAQLAEIPARQSAVTGCAASTAARRCRTRTDRPAAIRR